MIPVLVIVALSLFAAAFDCVARRPGGAAIRLDAANAVHRDGIRRSQLRRIFAEIYRPTEDLSVDFHPDLEVLRELDRVPKRDSRPLQGDRLRSRDFACAGDFLEVRRIQAGSVHLYIAYVAGALLAAMLAAMLWNGS
ncbi:MAG: hypothetical protein IPF53_18035 [Blastocatellia bacterium]|nr:hypothetical protein [Blastocatellia bacterium]